MYKLIDHINSDGAILHVSLADNHNARLKVQIIVVKERVRSIEQSLPYVMCRALFIACILYFVSRSKLICKLDPGYKEFLTNKGKLLVKQDRALYGLYEAGLMWYRNLRGKLQAIGYECNEYDKSVFNKHDENEIQITVGIHVDCRNPLH